MSRLDRTPYSAPEDLDDDEEPSGRVFAGGVDAPRPTLLRYRYLPRLKPALKGMLYSLACCALCVWYAANHLHGLRFAGLITLSPSATTRLFVILAIVLGGLVLFGLSSVTARFRPARYLVFREDALSIPLGRNRAQQNVAYASIEEIRLVGAREQSRLQLTTNDGRATVDGFMLESDEQLLEVEQALRERVGRLQSRESPKA